MPNGLAFCRRVRIRVPADFFENSLEIQKPQTILSASFCGGVAQWLECQPVTLDVAGSSPVAPATFFYFRFCSRMRRSRCEPGENLIFIRVFLKRFRLSASRRPSGAGPAAVCVGSLNRRVCSFCKSEQYGGALLSIAQSAVRRRDAAVLRSSGSTIGTSRAGRRRESTPFRASRKAVWRR